MISIGIFSWAIVFILSKDRHFPINSSLTEYVHSFVAIVFFKKKGLLIYFVFVYIILCEFIRYEPLEATKGHQIPPELKFQAVMSCLYGNWAEPGFSAKVVSAWTCWVTSHPCLFQSQWTIVSWAFTQVSKFSASLTCEISSNHFLTSIPFYLYINVVSLYKGFRIYMSIISHSSIESKWSSMAT